MSMPQLISHLPRRLVFTGGGTRCLVFVSALTELSAAGMLHNVDSYWGTSAGAMLAALLALTNKDVEKVKLALWSADYSKFRDVDVANVFGILDKWGLDDGASLTAELSRLLEATRAGGSRMVMRDLSGLHVVVSDLHAHETVVVSAANYPDLRIVDAIRASMSLPIFFRPFVCPTNGHMWVDGAVRANFPWNMLPDDEARRQSLGFSFEKTWEAGPRTFQEYIFSMIHFDEPKKIQTYKKLWGPQILWFPTPPYPAWFVRFRPEDFALVEAAGKHGYLAWIAQHAQQQQEQVKAGSSLPQETSGTLTPSELHRTPSPTFPAGRTTGSSGSPRAFPAPCRGSSPPQSPRKQRIFRRWSF
jgi:NTE family protein